ncbi:hypothetical protein PVT67_17870 [Gallaecimonas kandeliae]|uniref:hypothetical protein n=1 Tax=Gallaecimonas kandeliae TaxID=3029055 RepID=UPI00264A0B86|nr:hypothetical protein [Gallaecimonas kandeliae]WKE65511.1 hypothetical protein PVT67_17870 [Gallaecimonas kandeliae]
MENRIPLPTDNIYKFYALFGLVIFIFSLSSVLYLNRSTNDFFYNTALSIEALESIKIRTPVQETDLKLLKKKMDVSLDDKNFLLRCSGGVGGLGLLLILFGFYRWHTKVQPLQDELTELTVQKLRKDLESRPPRKAFKRR